MQLNPAIVMKGLGNMKELRFLVVGCERDDNHNFGEFNEVSQYLPNGLRYSGWDGYPFRCLPKSFRANNLVGLKITFRNIVQLWEGGKRKVK